MRNFTKFKNRIYHGNNVLNIKDLKYLPRWVVLLIDIFFLFITVVLSYVILLQLDIKPVAGFPFRYIALGIIALSLLSLRGLTGFID